MVAIENDQGRKFMVRRGDFILAEPNKIQRIIRFFAQICLIFGIISCVHTPERTSNCRTLQPKVQVCKVDYDHNIGKSYCKLYIQRKNYTHETNKFLCDGVLTPFIDEEVYYDPEFYEN